MKENFHPACQNCPGKIVWKERSARLASVEERARKIGEFVAEGSFICARGPQYIARHDRDGMFYESSICKMIPSRPAVNDLGLREEIDSIFPRPAEV